LYAAVADGIIDHTDTQLHKQVNTGLARDCSMMEYGVFALDSFADSKKISKQFVRTIFI